jgi:hypothetical protein
VVFQLKGFRSRSILCEVLTRKFLEVEALCVVLQLKRLTEWKHLMWCSHLKVLQSATTLFGVLARMVSQVEALCVVF